MSAQGRGAGGARRWVAQGVGAVAVGAILVVLPQDVFEGARDLLLVAAALVLVWVALAVLLAPARNALARAFALPLPRAPGLVALPAEEHLRTTFAPLAVPLVVLAVLAVATLLR